MTNRRISLKTLALGSCALGALIAGPAAAEQFSVQPQDLRPALQQFATQGDQQVLFSSAAVAGKHTAGFSGEASPEVALQALLVGTDLVWSKTAEGALLVKTRQEAAADPQGGSAAGDGAGTVEALIVTAQKREENIQDVPIAMSAFTQEDLTKRQVAGGPDLITQIPNMTFTKTNFTSYSIQIRGIGTQAISATTDPAVAVAFNNTPFIRNRFFEQEFYDLERVEVLRGPQGTLYGRNATAGVINLISAKPKFSYDSRLSVDIGNYSSRRYEAMVNIPLVDDKVALRIAGAATKRDGYATNQLTGAQIDGRDLWSVRASLRFEPTDFIHANLIYEHFQEDDDRLRSGKQLCKKNVVSKIGNLSIATTGTAAGGANGKQTYTSQGCEPVSLYSPEAFQTPNGFALPYYGPLGAVGLPIFQTNDPYLSATQSTNLRVVESSVDPVYRANSDLAELQISFDLTDSLTLTSETAYNADSLSSMQDFNRFTTRPGAFDVRNTGVFSNPSLISPTGVYCDPQIGCSDRLLLVDLSTSDSTQFSQEFRLGSHFDGPLNFSLGANYLRHDAVDKYYVFINSLGVWFAINNNPYVVGVSDGSGCADHPGAYGDTAKLSDPLVTYGVLGCGYMDPNPIGSLNDQGRQYFLSKNPYKLISYAAFGELYYELEPNLKVTAGLRFTVDEKTAPQIPSWLLAKNGPNNNSAGPYPTLQTVVQEWREPSGRLAVDWKPALPFTDSTLLYASYAHGYKAGGANPPPPVFTTYSGIGQPEIIPDVFGPEFVDALELGTKNTLLDSSLTLNLTGFYYDYKGYQVSEIRNRSAVNSNYDANVWGLEFETEWRPTEALRIGLKGGYNRTRIANGESAVDLMDRTAGHLGPDGKPDWVVLRPFPSMPSNCIVPVYVATAGGVLNAGGFTQNGACLNAYYFHLDPVTQQPYVPFPSLYSTSCNILVVITGGTCDLPYPGFDPSTAPNGGRGFSKPLGGKELPNAPRYTGTLTVDYTLPAFGDWLVTLHGDFHYQSESWARVFNTPGYDKLKAFSTTNFSAILTNDDGWKVMGYVKNVFDETAITGAFLNSDDTGLTTNVFLTEPRLYGVRVTKDWGGSIGGWSGGNSHHIPGTPYPFTVEIGAGIDQFSAKTQTYTPAFVGAYGPGFRFPLGVQDQDLDWGDTRDMRLTYAPARSPWRIWSAYSFGKTNGAGRQAAYESSGGTYDNRAISAVHDSEQHEFADFMVGHEVDFGLWGQGVSSIVGVGLRYADFNSTSKVAIDAVSGVVQSGFNVNKTVHTTSLISDRGFNGSGPQAAWEASLRLVGNDEAGHADLNWSLSGGVLFGKQGVNTSQYVFGRNDVPPVKTVLYNTTTVAHRGKDVTAPFAGATLGVSYAVDRVKVSTGYRYDRFFDVIDAGVASNRAYDRTIQGPYLKLSLGFGG